MEESGIPAADVLASALHVFEAVHANLREEIRNLDAKALNWTPASSVNSIAILVIHSLGSERAVLRLVLDLPDNRDRDAEFKASHDSVQELQRLLDAADADLDQARAGCTTDLLLARRTRRGETYPALHWLIENAAHAQEHKGQVSLLRNLYLASQDG